MNTYGIDIKEQNNHDVYYQCIGCHSMFPERMLGSRGNISFDCPLYNCRAIAIKMNYNPLFTKTTCVQKMKTIPEMEWKQVMKEISEKEYMKMRESMESKFKEWEKRLMQDFTDLFVAHAEEFPNKKNTD